MSTSYFITYWQPLSGLILGALIIALYLYLYLNRDKKIVPWIARYIFRNQNMTPSADSLFKVAGSYLLMFGGLVIILALLYLTH